jgi:hypothetical protein
MATKYYWRFNGGYGIHEITVSSMNELRRKLAQEMSKTKAQTLFVSKSRNVDGPISPTRFMIHNTYWGSLDPDMGEVYTWNGMRAFYKKTGELGGKTGV